MKYNDVALNEGTDYTVAYGNNKEVGTATVTVTGMGGYTGKVTKSFEIVAAKPKWVQKSGKWYYNLGNGKNAKGWLMIGGKWYFFKSDGSMAAKEWCKGYWLNKDGTCTYKYKASWKKDGKGWWYGDTSGWYAKNGWQQIDGKWYYFDAKGYIVTGSRTIGGKTYKFDVNGACTNP